ncbi:MAG: type II toxin-antitoxin system RelE family toxin [Planctomycetota bacterium]
MASYRVLLERTASKELVKSGRKADRRRLVARIRTLAAGPRPHGSEKLAGSGERCRIRAGSHRVLYAIDDVAREVHVVRIGHRSDVHR